MNSVSKTLTLTLVVLLLSSLLGLSVMPVSVQAVSKPSVPQFTVKFVDYSYDVPSTTTTTVDQFAGKETTTTIRGHHVTNKTIEITIKNQPFTTYTDTNNNNLELYYKVQYKRHSDNEQSWIDLGYSTSEASTNNPHVYVQSDAQYTVLSMSANHYVAGYQLDFRAVAVIGYTQLYFIEDKWFPVWSEFIVEATSGYSAVQTFTMPSEYPSSPSQTTTPLTNPITTPDNNQPQQPEQTRPSFVFHPLFLPLVVGFLFVGVVVVVVMVFIRRHLKGSTCSDNFTG